MSTEASVAIIVDALEFRRACIASLLGDWASSEEVGLLPLAPEEAHERLRTDRQCRLVILNAGATTQSLPDILAEIKVLRAMAPMAALVVVADREEPDDILAAMQAGAQAYLSNLLAPDLVFRALSFVLHGGTYFPRSLVDKGSFPVEPELEATPVQREAASEEPGRTRSGSSGLTVAATAGEDVVRSARMLDLSDRQMSILAGICRGEPNKIIGRTLNLPESTVKVHVREIMRKLAVSNRTQVALAFARVARPVAATASISRRAVNSLAETLARSSQVCDVIPLVPPTDSKVAEEIDKPSQSGKETSGRASTR
jgi:DNA-binding NarL/FixJ family response regulator